MERKVTAFLIFLGCTALFTTFYLSTTNKDTKDNDNTSVEKVQDESTEATQAKATQAEVTQAEDKTETAENVSASEEKEPTSDASDKQN